jgi:myosin heavy subunit
MGPEKLKNSISRPDGIKEKTTTNKVEKVRDANVVSAAKDALEFSEAVGFVDGKVKEVTSKSKDSKGDGPTGGQTTTQVDPAQAKAQRVAALLKKAPKSPKRMISEIVSGIQDEVKALEKKAKKISSNKKNTDYCQLNNTVKEIRTLKGILAQLFKTSLEGLKTLWLRFVHGIV